jgi:hypothetical protein
MLLLFEEPLPIWVTPLVKRLKITTDVEPSTSAIRSWQSSGSRQSCA